MNERIVPGLNEELVAPGVKRLEGDGVGHVES